MAHGQEVRSALRSAYIYKALSLEASAEQVSISFGTASRWKREAAANGDDWDKARSAARISSQGAEAVTQAVLEEFVTLFQSTLTAVKEDQQASPLSKAEAISRLSDAYNKTMSAVAKGSPKLNKLAIAMEVIQLQANYIRASHPHLAEPFADMLSGFAETITNAFG